MAQHYFFSQENLKQLMQELNAAVTMASGGVTTTVPVTEDLQYDIANMAFTYREVMAIRNQKEGAAILNRLFLRDFLQKYTTSAVTSVFNSAGLRVDQTLGRSTRDSDRGTVYERVDPINPVLARGGSVPTSMANKWKADRQNAMSAYNLPPRP